MRAFPIGLVLAVVLLGAAFFVPRLLRSSASVGAAEAARQAELARRLVMEHDPFVANLQDRAARMNLADADADKLVSENAEAFQALTSAFAEQARRAQQADQRSGIEGPRVTALNASGSSVKAAVSKLSTHASSSSQALTKAAAAAREATQSDSGVLGANAAGASAALLQAWEASNDARRLRSEQRSAEARTLEAALRWRQLQSWSDHYSRLDVAGAASEVQRDTGEFEQQLSDAQAEIARLESEIQTRERELAGIEAEIRSTAEALAGLEKNGFVLGNDSAFRAYSDEYRRLSGRLDALQSRQYLIEHGGLEGATLSGDPLRGIELAGGEPFAGLDRLKAELAVARDRARRLESGIASLGDQRKLLESTAAGAASEHARFEKLVAAAKTDLDRTQEALADLAKAAFEAEAEALKHARDAASLRGREKAAVAEWIREARDMKAKDTAGKNERLAMITGDNLIERAAAAAEATAKGIVGRVLTERLEGLRSFRETQDQLTRIVPGASYDAAALSEVIATTREEASNALSDASTGLERSAEQQATTSWAYQGALAGVYYLRAIADDSNAAQHRTNTIEMLRKALARRTQSPYVQAMRGLPLWNMLTDGEPLDGAAPPGAEAPEGDGTGDAG